MKAAKNGRPRAWQLSPRRVAASSAFRACSGNLPTPLRGSELTEMTRRGRKTGSIRSRSAARMSLASRPGATTKASRRAVGRRSRSSGATNRPSITPSIPVRIRFRPAREARRPPSFTRSVRRPRRRKCAGSNTSTMIAERERLGVGSRDERLRILLPGRPRQANAGVHGPGIAVHGSATGDGANLGRAENLLDPRAPGPLRFGRKLREQRRRGRDDPFDRRQIHRGLQQRADLQRGCHENAGRRDGFEREPDVQRIECFPAPGRSGRVQLQQNRGLEAVHMLRRHGGHDGSGSPAGPCGTAFPRRRCGRRERPSSSDARPARPCCPT